MNSIDMTAAPSSSTTTDVIHTIEQREELRQTPLAQVIKCLYAALLGPGASFGRRMLFRLLRRLEGGDMRSATLRNIMLQSHGVEIGAHSYGCFDPLRFPPGTNVGRYVSVGPLVRIYRRNHPLDRLSLHPYFYNPICGAAGPADVPTENLEIGADAWLGAHSIILPGCRRIGRGAVIAAGAVVTRDVPDYAVVGGSPARLIRPRFDSSTIKLAEHSQWWLFPPEQVIQQNDMTRSWLDVSREKEMSRHERA